MDSNALFKAKRATHFLLIATALVLTVAGVYGVLNIVAGFSLVGLAQLGAASLAASALAIMITRLRRGMPVKELPRRLAFTATVLLAMMLAVTGGGLSEVTPFMFVVPPALLFLGTQRSAVIANLLLIGVLVVSVIHPGLTAWIRGSDRSYHYSILVSYLALNLYVFMAADLRERAYRRVRFLASHDPVTGLPRFDAHHAPELTTRYAALIQLRQVEQIRLEGGNRFVQEVMAELARRLSRRRGPLCTLFSYSETSLLMAPALSGPEEWSQWITETLDDLTQPVVGEERRYSPQVLVYVVPDAVQLSRTELSARLETTIQGNQHPGQGVIFYNSDMSHILRARVEMSDLLRSAQSRGELHLVYQPLVDSIDGAVVGAEVLMRWTSHALGTVSPATFIPVAEENGLIAEFTEWMIATAWRESRADPEMRYRYLSVNISPIHIEQPDFLPRLRQLIHRERIDPAYISIEITEGVLLRESLSNQDVINELVKIGFSLSIDDFGTGYSNLTYLRRLAVHRIKIDRSFVSDLVHSDGSPNPRATPLVEAMVFMAKTLGIGTLAEGVETEAEAEILRDLGCETFQGYLFGKPSVLPDSTAEEASQNVG
ncbi:MAG TPA: EAL domain-containing protein [Alkalispirochaeta sp.]|nr:EAL domain-containing protein [Alkalispirochaeta sp.]